MRSPGRGGWRPGWRSASRLRCWSATPPPPSPMLSSRRDWGTTGAACSGPCRTAQPLPASSTASSEWRSAARGSGGSGAELLRTQQRPDALALRSYRQGCRCLQVDGEDVRLLVREPDQGIVHVVHGPWLRPVDGSDAHRAGFGADVELTVGQLMAAESFARPTDREHLGMCGGVLGDGDPVPGRGEDLAALDHDGPSGIALAD